MKVAELYIAGLSAMLMGVVKGTKSDYVKCVAGTTCASGLEDGSDALEDLLAHMPQYYMKEQPGNDCYSLTTDEGDTQLGMLQYNMTASPANSLDITAYIYLGDEVAPPDNKDPVHKDFFWPWCLPPACTEHAEGVAFVIAEKPIGDGVMACEGLDLGYMNCFDAYVAVIFDTEYNLKSGKDFMKVFVKKRNQESHIQASETVEWDDQLNRSKWHYIRTKYDDCTKKLEVYLVSKFSEPLVTLMSCGVDLMEVFDPITAEDGQLAFGYLGATSNSRSKNQAVCHPTAGLFNNYFEFGVELQQDQDGNFTSSVTDNVVTIKLNIDPVVPASCEALFARDPLCGSKRLEATLAGPPDGLYQWCVCGDDSGNGEAAFDLSIPFSGTAEEATLEIKIREDQLPHLDPGYYFGLSNDTQANISLCARVDYYYSGTDIQFYFKPQQTMWIPIHLALDRTNGFEVEVLELGQYQELGSILKMAEFPCEILAYRCSGQGQPAESPMHPDDPLMICVKLDEAACVEGVSLNEIWSLRIEILHLHIHFNMDPTARVTVTVIEEGVPVELPTGPVVDHHTFDGVQVISLSSKLQDLIWKLSAKEFSVIGEVQLTYHPPVPVICHFVNLSSYDTWRSFQFHVPLAKRAPTDATKPKKKNMKNPKKMKTKKKNSKKMNLKNMKVKMMEAKMMKKPKKKIQASRLRKKRACKKACTRKKDKKTEVKCRMRC